MLVLFVLGEEQTRRCMMLSLRAHGRAVHQLPLADKISDGQKNEVFSPELSRAYKGSSVHPGRLHWRPEINTKLYTSSIYPSTSPTIYLLLSSAFSLSSSLADKVHGRGSFMLFFMFFFLYLITTLLHETSSVLRKPHKVD